MANAAGQNDKSVLNRVVPGYYHRLQVASVLAAHLDGRNYSGAGFRDVLYFVNVDKVGQTLTIPEEAGKQYRLHPVHTAYDAADRRAGSATYDSASGRFTLPPRTAVVFVVR